MLEPKRKAETTRPDIREYRSFLDVLGIPVLVVDSRHDISFMNSAAKEKWGSKVGDKCFRALRKSLTACKDCPIDEVIRTKGVHRKRARLLSGEEWHDYENVYVFVAGPIDGISYVALACTDVEDTDRIERNALTYKALSKALLDSAEEIMIGLDRYGRVKFANRAVQKITGFPEEFVKSGGLKVLFPEDAIGALDEFMSHPEAEATKTPALIPVVTRDGDRRMVSWTMARLETYRSDSPGVLLLGQDVTERYLYRKSVEMRAREVELVNKILSTCSAAETQEKILAAAIEILVGALKMRAGVAYSFIPEMNAGRLVSEIGVSKNNLSETIIGTENIFPASAVYSGEIQTATTDTLMYEEAKNIATGEEFSGLVAIPVKPRGYPVGLLLLGHNLESEEIKSYLGLLSACREAVELSAENVFLRSRAEMRAREMESLYKLEKTLSEPHDIKDFLKVIAEEASGLLRPDICCVYLYDESSDRLELGSIVGLLPEEAEDSPLLTLADFKSVIGKTTGTVVLKDVDALGGLPEYAKRRYGIKTRAMAPLIFSGEIFGALLLDSRKERLYSTEELNFISAYAQEASSVLHAAVLMSRVRASEEKYRTLVELSRDPVCIVNGAGKILFTNRAGSSLLQKSVDEIISKNIFQFVTPEEMDETASALMEVASGKTQWKKKDVKAVINGEEMTFNVTASLLGGRGESAKIMLVLSDITEQERVLAKLRESEERYRTLVDRAGEAILLSDRRGEIAFANRAASEMLGLPCEEFLGRSIDDFIHPDDRERVRSDYELNWRQGGSVSSYRLKGLRSNGEAFWAEVNSAFLVDLDGQTKKLLLIRDVSEKVALEGERERRLKAQELLSSVAESLVQMGALRDPIAWGVKQVADFVRADRGYWAEIKREPLTAVCRFEWVAEGIEPAFGAGGSVEISSGSILGRKIGESAEFFACRVDEIEEPDERGEYLRRGTRAVAFSPLITKDGVIGFIGFERAREELTWDDAEKDLMARLGETVSFALEREKWVSKIRQSESFRARIEESIAEALMVLRNGVIVWSNQRVRDIYGYEPEELIGRTPEFLFYKPKRFESFAQEVIEEVYSKGRLGREEEGRRKDGSAIDVFVSVTPLGEAGAESDELLIAVEDITERKKAQLETEMALEAYSTIYTTARDALFVHNIEGNILDVNEMATTLTGYEYEELLKMNVKSLVSPKLAALYGDRLRELLRDGVTTFQMQLETKSGERIPAEAEARLTKIWGETVIISSVRDIRERVRAELEVEKRLVQLDILNELMRVATATMDLDVTCGAICEIMIHNTHADDGALLVIHYDEDKISVSTPEGSIIAYPSSFGGKEHISAFGKLVEDAGNAMIMVFESFAPGMTYSAILSPFHHKGFEEVLAIPLRSGERPVGLIALGSKTKGNFSAEEYSLYEAVGKEMGIAIDNLLVYKRLYNEHERLSTLLRSAQHISGEAELRAVLKATVEDALSTVGASAALIALKRDEGFHFFPATAGDVSASELAELNVPADQGIGAQAVAIGRALTAGWEGADMPGIKDPLLDKIGTRSAVAVPLMSGRGALGFLLICDPGGGRGISAEDVRLLEALGRQAAVAIEKARLLDDARRSLEALENANRELTSLDRMKSEFVSTVSHELRAPLAVIGGFAKTLVEHFDKIDRETERESLEIILNKTHALEELVENLLDMSRIEEGRLEVQIEPTDIVAICEQIRRDQNQVVEAHEIVLDAPEEGLIVLADPDKARVCVNNLVSNAVKFSLGGGRVTIKVARKEELAEISVMDTGIGIPLEEQGKIFDKFYQVERGETRGFPGSGLGLHITRELVRAMGGEIWVESEPGKGSTFTFTLPLARGG